MLRIETGPEDVAASRFAVAPAFELAMLMRTLLRAAPDAPLARRFARGLARVRDDPVVQAFAYLQGPGSGATFAAPPPAGMAQTIDDDLATVRGTPPEVVAEGVDGIRRERRPSRQVAAVLDADAVADRLADGIARAWHAILEPEWPRVRAVLERDVRFRAERLAQAGWSAALVDMHPRLAWTRGRIEVARGPSRSVPLDGRGLLLVPSVFLAPGLAVYDEAPWQPAIVYPARGAGLVFEEQVASTDPLAPLIGRSRAGLLLALATPSSTTQLAALTGASVGATGDHLRVLLQARLVAKGRIGRSVVYRRTPLGDALAGQGDVPAGGAQSTGRRPPRG